MRRVSWTALAVGCFIAASPLHAQTPAYPADSVIAVPETEVRCGPTDKFYVTSKLHQGDRVFVLAEVKNQPGWLAIKPPLGSFSWVNGKDVKMGTEKLGFIPADDGKNVTIRPGSSVVNQEPNVTSLQIKAGQTSPLEIGQGNTVVVVGKAQVAGDETWLPITPHPSEVRFIRADAIKPAVAVATNSTPNWTLKDNFFSTNPQLAEADQAARSGNVERAKQLYREAAQRSTDQNQKVFAMNRLSDLNRGSGIGATTWQNPGTTTTSFSPSLPSNVAATQQTTLPPQWSSYGRLRTTTLQADGQPVYALENDRGQPLGYVTSRAGTTLREYVNRTISVYGPTVYRGDGARMSYILASFVALP